MARPTLEDRVIALSAGTAERRHAAQAELRELHRAVDWGRLLELLSVRRLLPTLGPRIVELGGESVDERFRTGVAAALEQARRQGAFLALIGARARTALADAGIDSTALKGGTLSEALYGDLGRRQSSDIDLLVAPERLHDAVAVVCKLGYAAPQDPVGAGGLPLLHFALVHEQGTLPPIELHWRVHWYESRFARERLLAPACSPAGWRPAPVDELVAMLLFYARDGFIGLRHAADLAAWWDAFGPHLNKGALRETIDAYPALEPVLAAALRVAEQTVGLPSGQILRPGARLGRRGRIAVRLAEPYPHSSEAQLYAHIGLIDGLLSPPDGLREFVKRQAALSREPDRAGPRHVPAWSGSVPAHGARMCVRYGLAMSRLLRPRDSAHPTPV